MHVSPSLLDVFKAHCSFASNASIGTGMGGDDPKLHWFTSNHADEQGQPIMNLTHGIPETDAISFNASCRPGHADPIIPVDLVVDMRGLRHGDPAPVYIQTSTGTFQYQGMVFAQSGEWAGVRIGIFQTDPVWRAMQNESQLISYGVAGAHQTKSSPGSASSAIGAFMATRSIGTNSPQGPAQQPSFPAPGAQGTQPSAFPSPVLQLPTFPSPGAQQPSLPGASLQLPAFPSPGMQQPALPGMGQPGVPAAGMPQSGGAGTMAFPSPGAGSQQAPAMPQNAGGAQGFTCEDGRRLMVTTSAAGSTTIATVQGFGGQFALIAVPSQIGTKYSNGEATLTVNGPTAQFTTANGSVLCAQN